MFLLCTIMELMLSRPYPGLFLEGAQTQNIYYIVILLNLGFLYLVINRTGEISGARGAHTTTQLGPPLLGSDFGCSVLKRITVLVSGWVMGGLTQNKIVIGGSKYIGAPEFVL